MAKQILDQENKNPAIIHVEPREAVKGLLRGLKELKNEREKLLSEIPEDLRESIEYCEDKISATEKEIKALVSFEVQDSIKTNDGCANFRPGTKRVSYDRKILDAIQDYTIRIAIDSARKETQVKGSVTIDIY